MKAVVFLLLTACGSDAFFYIPPLVGDEAGDSSNINVDAGENEDARDAGPDTSKSDADSATVDAKPDGPCPTGTAACDDAIIVFCSRMKACCNGQCADAWANAGGSQCAAQFSTGGCPGKMICENSCLSDLQIASCTAIKGAPSPPYVASCWSLWQ